MNKYIMMFVAAIALVSCSDDLLETPSTPVEAGAEVQFGLSLESTRTIYGSEQTTANGKTVFPIYWVNGDKVQIYSPDCLQGRNAAEYKVSVEEANQVYADGLTPTGDTGIQWGNDKTVKANFYSFYPSGAYKLDPTTDNTQITGVKISTLQTIEYRGKDANEIDIIESNMQDCLMYASAKDVDYGATVNLQYKPITTVLMLKLSVDGNSTENFNVSKITLTAPSTAPSGIVGTFNVDLETGEFVKFADNTGIKSVETNIIDSETGGFHTITKGSSFEVPVFIAPVPGLKLEDWKIEIIANNKTYTKTIKEGEITYGNGNTGLVAGKIHRITLPTLKTENTGSGWQVADWMKNIPRNVYLSEVSIPGSWDTFNDERQSKVTINDQYNAGVRAFHLDTRWQGSGGILGLWGSCSGVLGIADGTNSTDIGGGRVMTSSSNKKFETVLSEIKSKISTDKEQYMVVVCSFAHDSYNYSGTNGNWYGEISAICNSDTFKDVVYDARNLTKNTVIGEVLGKIIVIINVPEKITATTALPKDSRCLFIYQPSQMTSAHFATSSYETENKNDFMVSNSAEDGTSIAKQSGIQTYSNLVQISSSTSSGIQTTDSAGRGYAPSQTERSAVLENILSWSKGNYNKDNYAHDMWIYMGLGGYNTNSTNGKEPDNDKDSDADVAALYNNWINGKVTEMGTTPTGLTAKVPYYPVGIVLMNYVNDYASVVKNILLLNNKYQLQFDPNKSTKTEDYALQQADYDGTLTNGGNAIQ